VYESLSQEAISESNMLFRRNLILVVYGLGDIFQKRNGLNRYENKQIAIIYVD